MLQDYTTTRLQDYTDKIYMYKNTGNTKTTIIQAYNTRVQCINTRTQEYTRTQIHTYTHTKIQTSKHTRIEAYNAIIQ